MSRSPSPSSYSVHLSDVTDNDVIMMAITPQPETRIQPPQDPFTQALLTKRQPQALGYKRPRGPSPSHY